MTVPERKDKTPFVASRVLDGTTSKFDWTGRIIPLKDLPQSLNPEKGYLMTANGRQTSDNALSDVGATTNSPGRTLRIDEILREGVAAGKKFTLEDLGAIQQDVIDVVARRMTPKIVEIAQRTQLASPQERQQLEEMLALMRDWRGSFDEQSVSASIYTRWYIQFVRKLFMKYEPDNEDDRLAFSDNYHFTDAFQRIITSVHEE